MSMDQPLLQQPADIEKSAQFCDICYDSHPPTAFIANDACQHTFCKDSYRDFLTYQITQSGSKGFFIKCPQQKCEQALSKEFIQALCDADTYQKFLRFQLDKEVMESDTKKFCPNPKCDNVVVEAGGHENNKKVQCHNCMEHFCFQCMCMPWHEKMSCDEAQAKLLKGWAANKAAQRCPKCAIPIEKNEGCKHMTCTQCKYQWCWICGDKWIGVRHTSGSLWQQLACDSLQNPPDNCCNSFRYTIYWLLLVIFQPLVSLSMGVGKFMDEIRIDRGVIKVTRFHIVLNIFLSLLVLPINIIVVFLWLCGSIGFGLALILPSFFVSIFRNTRFYCKAMRYWSRRKRFNKKK